MAFPHQYEFTKRLNHPERVGPRIKTTPKATADSWCIPPRWKIGPCRHRYSQKPGRWTSEFWNHPCMILIYLVASSKGGPCFNTKTRFNYIQFRMIWDTPHFRKLPRGCANAQAAVQKTVPRGCNGKKRTKPRQLTWESPQWPKWRNGRTLLPGNLHVFPSF